MSITSDEVNFLIYRYLQENGFTHSAFTFAYESLVTKSSNAHIELPPGALITFLQKGLEYVGIEEHINEDGSIQEFDTNYSLLSPFVCDLIATKEDRRMRRIQSKESVALEEASSEANIDNQGAATPSTISLRREGGAKFLSLVGHQGEVFMCVWNPVRMQLASGSADGMCRLWGLWEMDSDEWSRDVAEQRLRTAILPHTASVGERFKDVTSVSWSPDGQYLATGCYDGKARVWDAQGNLVRLLQEHTGPVFSLKWNKNGMYILSGSYDRRAIVWEAATGKILRTYMLHSAPVLDVDWKDSETFATCSSDMCIHVCKVSQEDESTSSKTFTGHSDEVNAVCWSPGGLLLASCSDDSTAKIWSEESGLKFDLRGHAKEIYTIRWTPTGPSSPNPELPLYVCTASFDGTVKVWSAVTGSLAFDFRRQPQPVYSIAPSPSGEFLATGSLGGYVTVWSLVDGSMVNETQGSGDTFDVSWSCDSSMLCSCFSSGVLTVLDTSTWKSLSSEKALPHTSTAPAIIHNDETSEVNNSNNSGKVVPPVVKMEEEASGGEVVVPPLVEQEVVVNKPNTAVVEESAPVSDSNAASMDVVDPTAGHMADPNPNPNTNPVDSNSHPISDNENNNSANNDVNNNNNSNGDVAIKKEICSKLEEAVHATCDESRDNNCINDSESNENETQQVETANNSMEVQ